MTRPAYYNEHDPYCAQWLRNLIAEGLIAPGEVDERDIRDVRPADLAGYGQCHFFAGVGVWSFALRLADVPDDGRVWTGSCPCQPFSSAGRRDGFADERHLWPAFFHLIRVCRPDRVYGEQVASSDGLVWLDLVCSDLEGEAYAVGASDLPIAGFGGPNIRQRLWWVAHPQDLGRAARWSGRAERRTEVEPVRHGDALILADSRRQRCDGEPIRLQPGRQGQARPEAARGGASRGLDLAAGGGREGVGPQPKHIEPGQAGKGPGPVNGFWAGAEWIHCRDGRIRPVEPGSFPLAHRAPARVGRLRAYGNAISPWPAAAFIREAEMILRGQGGGGGEETGHG